ncbi:MAG: fimbrillin family protein [Candidatus Cryptobacteroides sp.]
MIKALRYTPLAAAALLFAASCTKDYVGSSYLSDPDAVRISAQLWDGAANGILATRSNPVGKGDAQTAFNSDDRVCVTADNQPDVVYSYDGTNWTPESGKFLKWLTPEMTFSAYYPVAEGVDAQTFAVPADQSDEGKIAAADYATCSQQITRNGNNPVPLAFQRKMARIVVVPTFKNQFDAAEYSISQVTVCGNTTGYSDGSVAAGNVEVTAFKQGDNSNQGVQFYALLSPTTASDETFIKVTVRKNDNSEVQLEAKGIIATEAGKSYIVNLSVGKYVASVSGVTVSPWASGEPISVGEADEIPYVTFSAAREQKFNMTISDSFTLGADEYFEYSVGGGNWTRFTKTVENIAFGGALGNLRLRGKSSKGTASYNTTYSTISFSEDVPVNCTGDIRTLIDYTKYSSDATGDAKFCYLFQNCTALTSAPELPATNLATFCYERMFYGCTALTTAPELPATNLANYCYRYMFNGCTSLETAPALKATSLPTSCYKSMFYGCTKLSSVTMLATDVSGDQCLDNWLTDAGTSASTRTLTLASETVYNTLAGNSYYLPDNWKNVDGGAKVIFKDSSSTE